MKVVFIAIPTAGTVKDGKLTEEFLAYFAKLHVENPGVTFISPMTQDYALLPFMPTRAATWEDWGAHCRAIIPRCDEMWVLTFKGWDTSVGVTAEIQCAHENNVPVSYKDVESLSSGGEVKLSGAEIDTLIALVENGPLWDGDIPSKAGRDDLIEKGLAVKVIVNGEDGYQAATYAGRDVYKDRYPDPDDGSAADTIAEAKANRKRSRELRLQKPPKLGTTTSSSAEATKNFQFEKPHT